ncbi:N-acetylmuramoyl-L-alanine amidase [Corynebacterium heidelbergense]|uniref:N-acetylmuramoyl-L-alanine amidase n=1 Tax=Corynebacterium heidelbergense TaxID=2055947 RepID=A0A364V8A0_9CORY|nr:N-acetylmuramoyl-L-alanine amidase [Corynebacterium heidelbergense]RAV32875.1 N-acetylmuramoyl-L-alanine amidase [Corynebacterium heidelbergense]
MNRLILQVGDSSPRVAEVRGALARLGRLEGFTGDLTGRDVQRFTESEEYFDPGLATALKAFQQSRGIIADGTITEGTLRALREASYSLGARVLSLQANHMVGDDVAQLQTQLHDLGFYTSRVDGHFGPATHSAVANYQRDYALTPDGTVGPATLRALSYLGRRITGGSPQSIREKEQIRAAGPQLSGKRVVIDPGLGGGAPGYTVRGRYGEVTEEEILWDLAGRIEGRMITAGMETIMSRTRSANPTNQDRANIANAFGADLVISLRADIYQNEKANGVACFYFGSHSGYSSMIGEKLSGFIQREITARTPLRNCYNHRRTWDVLRLTTMPTVQVVPGYLTNPGDVQILTNPEMRDIIAEAIVVSVKRLYLLDKDVHATGTYTFSELLKHESAG